MTREEAEKFINNAIKDYMLVSSRNLKPEWLSMYYLKLKGSLIHSTSETKERIKQELIEYTLIYHSPLAKAMREDE